MHCVHKKTKRLTIVTKRSTLLNGPTIHAC